MSYLTIFSAIISALLSGIGLVWFSLWAARRFNFGLDRPDPARGHHRRLPRIGGLALYGAFVLGSLTGLLPVDWANPQIRGVFMTVTLVMLAGFIDDLFDLKPVVKFAAQVGVALLAALGFEILIRFINNPLGGRLAFGYELSVLISLAWLLGVMNVTNLLDGVDGLATGVLIVFAFMLLIVAVVFQQRELSILAAALLGATAAFLLFNFSPAKIIMGDSGALFLGLLAGELAILAGAKLATVMLILAIPIADTAYTILRRLWAGRPIAGRDAQHLHHRLLAIGLSQRQVCFVYYAIAGSFGLVTLIPITSLKVLAMGAAFLAYLGLLIFVNRRAEQQIRKDAPQPPRFQ